MCLSNSLILPAFFFFFFFFSHSQVYARGQAPLDTLPLRADLQCSYISPGLSFMSAPFSASVCWKPRTVRGYYCEGLPGPTGAPGRVLCSSHVVLLVTGARGARAPPAGPRLRARRRERTRLLMEGWRGGGEEGGELKVSL